jgi:hypothetical protein
METDTAAGSLLDEIDEGDNLNWHLDGKLLNKIC